MTISSCHSSVDGIFGRCHELANADLYTYDISASALQRLRILLQKLAHRGLTWQDDITQQVISRELSKLRNIPLRHQSSPQSPMTASSSSRNWKVRPAQAELSRNLEQYLTGLGFLHHTQIDQQPGLQREGGKIQNEDIRPLSPSETSRSKPKQAWKETTIYSLQKGAGQPPVTKVVSQGGEGRHPKLSTTHSSQEPDRNNLLSKHLERILAGAPSSQRGVPGGEAVWPKGKLHYINYIQPAQSELAEPQTPVAFGSKSAKPNLDRLLFKAGSGRLDAKQPLGGIDDHFISNAVNQLGRHSIDMDALMGKDLDQLAGVITGALLELDEKQPALGAQPKPGGTDSRGEMEANWEPPVALHQNQNQNLKSDEGQDLNQKYTLKMKQQGQQMDGADKESIDKHSAFFSKLLDYLNMESFGDKPRINGEPPAPPQKMVGLENVHSHTVQGQVSLPHLSEEKTLTLPAKEGTTLQLTGTAEGPGAQVDSEIERWMQGDQAPAGKKELDEPQKKDMKIKTQLVHVGVKEFSSRGKDRHFGYIITGSDSLTNDQGLDLMKHVTQRLSLHAEDLTQLSVLGPALTFRVGPNPKNVTTADLVQVAGGGWELGEDTPIVLAVTPRRPQRPSEPLRGLKGPRGHAKAMSPQAPRPDHMGSVTRSIVLLNVDTTEMMDIVCISMVWYTPWYTPSDSLSPGVKAKPSVQILYICLTERVCPPSVQQKQQLEKETGLKIVEAGVSDYLSK
ncbi:unnamed protein product [Menidia menidia]|uniref:(Atlantic silverside) hypothetical protein n=1 Tax=Menidia menidia TaxID=238744 RepID=A0A8S4ANR0_9TELE|nr:unnamed protein product [Menidia menidia]